MAAATTASAALLRTLRSSTPRNSSIASLASRSSGPLIFLSNNAALSARNNHAAPAQIIRRFSSHPFVLSHPSSVEGGDGENTRGRIVCITSGKGGVGKTSELICCWLFIVDKSA
jgi:Mrp family chromosome partitioning ATPase